VTNPPVALGEHGRAFARNLRNVRKALGLTVDALASQLADRGHRLTADQIIRIEAGQRRATVDDLCQIAHLSGINIGRLTSPSTLRLTPNRPLRGVHADREGTTGQIVGGVVAC
jgi:transcriptional regulator with XRE-family HTH domain